MSVEDLNRQCIVDTLKSIILLADAKNTNQSTQLTRLLKLVNELKQALKPPIGYYLDMDNFLDWLVGIMQSQFDFADITLLHNFLDPIDISGGSEEVYAIVNLLLATKVCIQDHTANCELPQFVKFPTEAQSVPDHQTGTAAVREATPLAKLIEFFVCFFREVMAQLKTGCTKLVKLCSSPPVVSSPQRLTSTLWLVEASPVRHSPRVNLGGLPSPSPCV